MNEELTDLVPSLRKFAFSLTGNIHDADDLLQATVEKLLSKPLPQEATLMAWAFRVCRNIWIDEYRAQKVRTQAAASPELRAQEQGALDTALTSEMTLRQVTKAMDDLPNEQRETLSLIAVQGMSYRDASAVLEVPTGTIMSRLARARAKLSNVLRANNEVLS